MLDISFIKTIYEWSSAGDLANRVKLQTVECGVKNKPPLVNKERNFLFSDVG